MHTYNYMMRAAYALGWLGRKPMKSRDTDDVTYSFKWLVFHFYTVIVNRFIFIFAIYWTQLHASSNYNERQARAFTSVPVVGFPV